MISLITILLLPTSVLAAGKFSFDPASDLGPQNWATLDIENNECGGNSQSGINVVTGQCDELMADYTFNAGTCTADDLTFLINDHVIQVTFDTTINNCTAPSMVIANTDTTFDVLQYHIHAGSDHSLDGAHYGADMHIVHKNRDGDDLAVLGMFLEATNDVDSGLFDIMIEGLDAVAEKTEMICSNSTDGVATQGGRRRRSMSKNRKLQDVYNPYAKLPPNSTMYYYSGGLTTPPCSEIVSWNVVDTPISLSVAEFKDIIDLILEYVDPTTCIPASVSSPSGYTSRPTQPLNGRTVTHKCPTGTEVRFETESNSTDPAPSPTSHAVGTMLGSYTIVAPIAFASLASLLM